jgi:hypothetical protein
MEVTLNSTSIASYAKNPKWHAPKIYNKMPQI